MSNAAMFTPSSRARRVAARVLVAGALLVSGLGVSTVSAQAPKAPIAPMALPSGASKYSPGPAIRLADTRPGGTGYSVIDTGPYGSTQRIRVDISHRDGLPEGTITAAVLSVVFANTGGGGYVNVWPSDKSMPTTSNVNSDAALRSVANLVHVKVSASGTVDLYRSTFGALVVDLVGVYVQVGANPRDGRFVSIDPASTSRVLDTRNTTAFAADTTRTVDLAASGIPAGVSAVVVNLTATQAAMGYWTAFEFGTSLPAENAGRTSNLNLDRAFQTRAVQAIIPMNGTDKKFQVYSKNGGHLLVDVAGWYTDSTAGTSDAGVFVANDTPVRSYDTRRDEGTRTPWAGSTFEFKPFCKAAPANSIAAVAMNLTATQPWDNGFVSAYPAGVKEFLNPVVSPATPKVPKSSNLNINTWPQTIANHAIVAYTGSSSRGVALYTSGGAHMIADIAGCFIGTSATATIAKPASPNYSANHILKAIAPQARGPKVVSTDFDLRYGINSFVGYTSGGTLDGIADAGYGATWTDTSYLAALGNVMIFGHRTAHGGPFRYLHLMNIGDTYQLVGTDGNTYNYRVVDKVVTAPSFQAVTARAAGWGQITSQLVACSKADGLPTSVNYRIVVTGRLVSITPGA